LALGLASVGYWALTENAGGGDLRLYALVQFLPVILIPLILVLYKPARIYASSLWLLILLYIFAKLFELFDLQVFVLTGIVSGHTIKHVIAALAAMALLRMLHERKDELLKDVQFVE
jgi:hypothetical protein